MKNRIKSTILISTLLCAIGSLIALALITKTPPHNWDHLEYHSRHVTVGDNENNEYVDYESNLQLRSQSSDTLYRIYIDSSGNTKLPASDGKTNDYVIGKGKKNRWYQHLIHGLSIDVTKYAKSKNDFIKRYKAVTFSYFYNYNFWNSWDGWTYKYGKSSPLNTGVESYPLSLQNKEWLIFDKSDPAHNNNERANLVVKQKWNGNILSYDFYLGVSYYWQTGSIVKHATIASFTSDEYTFTKVSGKEENWAFKTDTIKNKSSSFLINESSRKIEFDDLDEKISKKSSDLIDSKFKKTSVLIMGYFGSLEIDNKVNNVEIKRNGQSRFK